MMDSQEQSAFVDAYMGNVGDVPREYVTDFVRRYEGGEEVPYQSAHTAIMDALGIWNEAIKYILKETIK